MRCRILPMTLLGMLLAGCARDPATLQALEQARSRIAPLADDPQVMAQAPLDVTRARETLARAERLAEFVGGAADARHYAQLSERYAAIALEHGRQAADREELARLKRQEQRLQQVLREVQLQRAEDHSRWLEEQLAMLSSAEGERGLVMTLGDVLFDFGSAELHPRATRTLVQLYRFLQRYPQRSVRIEGYTDNRGTAARNLQLALARAQAVAALLEALGLDAQRIEVRGYGEAYPLVANASSRGRAQNRRVEIVLSDEQGRLGPERP
ncbi:OmpA family protein [Pseudomonas sp. NW5]|uniref:OmpA family protein n=1 Tax=Pseudomonas sp. NW5 TaxID=2934934 RepID=UPI0020202AD2|nr:OmpA family protein [Pseudomonas sp. NW5]MCL7463211.1 OmpA family protein [Pseudomonas sp. NW5]